MTAHARLAALVLAAGGVVGAVAGAAGAQELHAVSLPVPSAPLSARPPFPATSRFTIANVFRPPIESTERVLVGLDGTGKATAVRVVQRLRLPTLGDYLLSVPGPIVDVAPGAGTDSQPGLRRGALVWQGFSPGGRVLVASVRLDAARARGALPLRFSFAQIAGGMRVSIRNQTALRVRTATGNGDAVEIARILDRLRRDPTGGSLGPSAYANISGRVIRRSIVAGAPLRLAGTIDAGGAKRRIDRLLGADGADVVVVVPGTGKLRIALEAEPVVPPATLRPPFGRSWVDAVRRAPRLLTGRRMLDTAWKVLAQVTRVHQYGTYLANPDPNGSARASYAFRTVRSAAPPAPPGPASGSGLGPVAIALIAAAATAAAGGLVVLWAHS